MRAKEVFEYGNFQYYKKFCYYRKRESDCICKCVRRICKCSCDSQKSVRKAVDRPEGNKNIDDESKGEKCEWINFPISIFASTLCKKVRKKSERLIYERLSPIFLALGIWMLKLF